MFDPGLSNLDTKAWIKISGFPELSGKYCITSQQKDILTTYQTVSNPGAKTYSPGLGVTVTAYCANSRMLQLAGFVSAAALAASSQLI